MNIKQAQELSGVSADNIRFYEKQGLLRPRRNPDNDYRDYDSGDIRTLKLIRTLRMLDLPLEQVKAVLDRAVPLAQAAAEQQKQLEDRSVQLQAAIALCREVSALPDLDALDVDDLLARMDDPAQRGGFFQNWVDDYRKVARSEAEMRFTFLPEGAVTNPAEFTQALLEYARDSGLDLTITKESMYPEFTLDGVEYTATRHYTVVRGCPVASVHCRVLHPEDFAPDGVEPWRRRLLTLLHHLWLPVLVFLLVLLPRMDLLASWEGWLILASILTVVGVSSFRSWLLFYNEKGKQGKKP